MPDAAATVKPRVLSGITATGALHIGNYIGALSVWAIEQDRLGVARSGAFEVGSGPRGRLPSQPWPGQPWPGWALPSTCTPAANWASRVLSQPSDVGAWMTTQRPSAPW
jgi:hypothetical protein